MMTLNFFTPRKTRARFYNYTLILMKSMTNLSLIVLYDHRKIYFPYILSVLHLKIYCGKNMSY